jgi:hypothetical protein
LVDEEYAEKEQKGRKGGKDELGTDVPISFAVGSIIHPVDPNPPLPRSEGGSSRTLTNSACTTGVNTICAIRSPG